jgi:GT2 family glycosyltransferase
LRAANPFWDELFIYNEEVDLSIRVLRASYRILYPPVARVYHRRSG